MSYDIILDCYTDEPSGLGVPPYLGVHQRYIAGCLSLMKRRYYYMTIDDLRYNAGEKQAEEGNTNIRIKNLTKNCEKISKILSGGERLFVVMGGFVRYNYLSIMPTNFDEIRKLIGNVKYTKILFYALGGIKLSTNVVKRVVPEGLFDDIVFGNSYNYLLNKQDSFQPNYHLLKRVTTQSPNIVLQIPYPIIAEIETATGCNREKGCSFCIENARGLPLEFRDMSDIIDEIKQLYKKGIRHFRLGRQPNFYAYMHSNSDKIEQLLYSIRESCPEIKMLHVDNTSPQDIASDSGKEITKHIVQYCTSGNIGPLGVESFDPKVRVLNNLNGSVNEILEAISIMNYYGKERGDDGLPKFLPGLNFIYNLPGQTLDTLKYNLEKLDYIFSRGDFVRRVFVRALASPYGVAFDDTNISEKEEREINTWQALVLERFAVPMLKRVFPKGLILRNFRSELWKRHSTICRKLATCSVRVIIPNQLLPMDKFYDIQVEGYQDNRTLIGKIV